MFLSYSEISWGQESFAFKEFSNLSADDTLVIDIRNVGCRVSPGDRYLICRNDSSYSVFQIIDFHLIYFIEGKEIEPNKEKQKFFLKNIGKLGDEQVKFRKMNPDTFKNFMIELEKIIESNNVDGVKIAGTKSCLTLTLNDKIFSREFKGWIELNKN